ncbi:flavodoxin domain-containing protein [Actinokineospora globicatena]|uniref:flavodoxin domain-containing protein n=1 Tax=Actinokineospora globicatena TaxID=103729 RepID=UPI0020A49749|nr:flavodoxin domain-containing protein [Actinokineospora globicatena]MCP2306143.1 menaquinone-dependent protoporphyrinogen oxidase [Actinokineospora globicatena]
MQRALVLYASKMGSTKEIAEAVGAELAAHGLRVKVHDVLEVRALDGYDTVVLGSAVYVARWRRGAARFFRRHREELARRRVWLFESGWVGTRPGTPVATRGGRRRAARVGASAPTVFGGRLDPALARGAVDRAIARKSTGDYRDWDEIRAWAAGIARAVATAPATEQPPAGPPGLSTQVQPRTG